MSVAGVRRSDMTRPTTGHDLEMVAVGPEGQKRLLSLRLFVSLPPGANNK